MAVINHPNQKQLTESFFWLMVSEESRAMVVEQREDNQQLAWRQEGKLRAHVLNHRHKAQRTN